AIPAGSSLAIVGQNGAGKTTIAKLLCRLYDPQDGAIEVDGVDLRTLELEAWRSRLAAVFQDFVRFELPLRDNVAPGSAPGDVPDEVIERALAEAGATGLAGLDTVLARGYPGGTDLSGGQWQRIALARALCAVQLGAGLVLLDEPTAQLDVRGEAEIFDRILAATRRTTTILISHRFSTVRHADRICVAHRREAVRDEDRGGAARGGENAIEDLGLAPDVELGRWLIEQHQAGSQLHGAQCPRQRDPLPLAARQVRTAGVAAGQHRVEAGESSGTRLREGPLDHLVWHVARGAARSHVVTQRQLEADEVLEDGGETRAPCLQLERAEVDAVYFDGAVLRVVQPAQQLRDGSLAG